MIKTFNMDNMDVSRLGDSRANIIYADYIYENLDFSWAKKFWDYLADDGVFIAQTDWHSNHRYRVFMEDVCGGVFVNDAVWRCEWGNHPKDRFHQCFDNVIIYAKSKNWTFDASKIQVPKATVSKGMNPSGRLTKTATAWIDDCVLTTTAKERVKRDDGKLIRWQKPQSLYSRVILPFLKQGDSVLDIFMGSASLGVWCKQNGYDYIGIEKDEEVYRYALANLARDDYRPNLLEIS